MSPICERSICSVVTSAIAGWGIIASDIGLAAMTSLLSYVGFTYGGKTVLMYYFIPYMVSAEFFPRSSYSL